MNPLIIILGDTKASEITFNNFKVNVYDRLNADLCVCIGVQSDYNYNNPFYQLAKHRFLYNESTDEFQNTYNYGKAFESAYKEISNRKPELERYENSSNLEPLHWRKFSKIYPFFMNGLKNDENAHRNTDGALIFFRWFLLKNLKENNLINQYDRFIITKSDLFYESQFPFPKLELMSPEYIWIPNQEIKDGYTDRQLVLSKTNIEPYLNILTNITLRSNEYYNKMVELNKDEWDLEQFIKFHLKQNNVLHLVKLYPYMMYSVGIINGKTSWGYESLAPDHGFYIKYIGEYEIFNKYKKLYETSKLTIDNFYIKAIADLNN